ncbi:MAG: bifunctional tRNA (5-methylaminomethyl-2-thiouridine)(34)-methyltransferase MnmD/FAD-dependent 5-carboxymethylaminomethyl-2-thiouridine(34) oxidoreductase MnmC [Magnetococcus sp. WYHC-3]
MSGLPWPSLSPPTLDWGLDQTPRSREYDDIYYSPGNGLAESRHVFPGGLDLPRRWAGRGRFVLGETGFGTGLNFLLTWDLWRQTQPPSARLHYLAVEAHPLGREDLQRALSPFVELSPLARELVACWPMAHPGFHLRLLDGGRVILLLMFGDASACLGQLRAHVDGWYLDGFAPARNPAMWCPALFRELARLSLPGAPLATFSAAGVVRRGLEDVGFITRKTPGYGRKRERLVGEYAGPVTALEQSDAPWWRGPAPAASASVAIIGAGVAGCASAHMLAALGGEPQVFEQHDGPAQEASGNPSGLVEPRLTRDYSLPGRFHTGAFLDAVALYDALAARGNNGWREPRGLLSLATDADAARHGELLAQSLHWPESWLDWLSPDQVAQRYGLPGSHGGLWLGQAGVANPPALCRHLLGDVPCRTGCRVERLEHVGDVWVGRDQQGRILLEAPTVILANAMDCARLLPHWRRGLAANRGQISLYPEADPALPPAAGVVFDSYVTPPFADPEGQWLRVVGASYTPWDERHRPDWGEERQDDHARVRLALEKQWPALAARLPASPVGYRAALRATTADRMPVAGPLPDWDACQRIYASLRHGPGNRTFPDAPTLPGLYAVTGLGSRGLQTAPLAAALVAARVLGTPWPLEADLAQAVHPARFLIRALRQGKMPS